MATVAALSLGTLAATPALAFAAEEPVVDVELCADVNAALAAGDLDVLADLAAALDLEIGEGASVSSVLAGLCPADEEPTDEPEDEEPETPVVVAPDPEDEECEDEDKPVVVAPVDSDDDEPEVIAVPVKHGSDDEPRDIKVVSNRAVVPAAVSGPASGSVSVYPRGGVDAGGGSTASDVVNAGTNVPLAAGGGVLLAAAGVLGWLALPKAPVGAHRPRGGSHRAA